MSARYYEEAPCEHGEVKRHPTPVVLVNRLGPGKDDIGYDWENMCPGGQRRELTGFTVTRVVYDQTTEEPE